ncbi:fructose-bisphosphate aldolase [Archaeoglobales archaeon]|nr:MAG: fructose-bisphosphate aldolase [Archaeoglobales archaeon]
MLGKKRRLKRIMRKGKTLIVPMDHGITKPPEGLENVDRILKSIDGVADAVVLHKGVAKHSCYLPEAELGLIVHLSASTSLSKDPNDKRIITTVENAISLGADAVSVHVNVGSESEANQIVEVGRIAETCDSYGIPLLAMMYARGEKVKENVESIKHAVRVGFELGADIVKTSYTGSIESFMKVVKVAQIPVVMAGGSKIDDVKLLEDVKDAMLAGAAGVAIGRNVFQHKNPRLIVKALRMIIHEDAEVYEAREVLKEVLNEGDMVVKP